jgi:hypothetical protein
MKANPGANIAALGTAMGKSRTSTVSALRPLRDAGLAESKDRGWTLTEPTAPKETARWIEPVSAEILGRLITTPVWLVHLLVSHSFVNLWPLPMHTKLG